MPQTDVIHLVWKPAGTELLQNFVSSYRRHPAGAEHQLTVLYNGFRGDDLAEHRSVMSGLEHRELVTPRPTLDIPAYFWAAERSSASFVCFLNSYTVLLADDWLGKLLQPVLRPEVGAAGATGSWESVYTAYLQRISSMGRPSSPIGMAKHLNRLRKLRRYSKHFHPAPNPHLRSNAFVIRRTRWLALERPALRTKWQTLRFENGKKSMSHQLRSAGLQVLVVGRDGTAYPPDEWRGSLTFREGHQENLLVADNRTRQYDEADEPARRHLREIAWGES